MLLLLLLLLLLLFIQEPQASGYFFVDAYPNSSKLIYTINYCPSAWSKALSFKNT